jgi:hypothetical protein
MQETRENIAYCYLRAEVARRMAFRSERYEFQQLHREAERRWLSLAHSYETAQRIVHDAPHGRAQAGMPIDRSHVA